MWVLDRIHPRVEYVRIDPWDTWSMDHTLAMIVLPMLRQLKATSHGAPLVDDEDVPEELRSTSAPPRENDWDTDANHFRRWDWVMDEMIFAFETKCNDNYVFEISEEDRQRVRNGFRLFGKYYEGLWD
jgi:hypothetical protein